MSWKQILDRSGLAANLADAAIKMIADQVNKELESKLVDACAAQFAAEDRVSDLEHDLAKAMAHIADLEKQAGSETR